MAGVGFKLRKMSPRDSLFAPLASMGHAAVIAAGPWIFTAVALVAITQLSQPAISVETLSGFRVIGIYAFCLSLVATAPIAIVVTRLAGDAIFMRKFDLIRPLFVAALTIGAGLTALLSLFVYIVVLNVPLELSLLGTAACILVGMIWISLTFCGSIRDYRSITVTFGLGLFVAVVATTSETALSYAIPGMVLGFMIGLSIIFFGLTTRILMTFPQPLGDLREPILKLLAGMNHYWVLALGALMSTVAIWIDKWIMWTGPIGERLTIGLVHAPKYDSAMFIACLMGIPGLALFVTSLETTFLETYRRYYDSISNHAALSQIRTNVVELERETVRTIVRIVCIQATICAIVTLAASLVVEATGLLYQQAGILRMGVLSVLFQFLFFACSSMLLFFARYLHYALLQGLFLLTNIGFTIYTLYLGIEYYGLGILLASITCGLTSFLVLESTMHQLNYLTFIVGNRKNAFSV